MDFDPTTTFKQLNLRIPRITGSTALWNAVEIDDALPIWRCAYRLVFDCSAAWRIEVIPHMSDEIVRGLGTWDIISRAAPVVVIRTEGDKTVR